MRVHVCASACCNTCICLAVLSCPGVCALQVTFDQTRGVSAYSWAEDGSAIFYIQDNNGDENDHLYMVPLASLKKGQQAAPIDLTPFKGVKASGIVGSKRFPGGQLAWLRDTCL